MTLNKKTLKIVSLCEEHDEARMRRNNKRLREIDGLLLPLIGADSLELLWSGGEIEEILEGQGI